MNIVNISRRYRTAWRDYAPTTKGPLLGDMTKREWIKAGCPRYQPVLILDSEKSRQALREISPGKVIPFRRNENV